ncbi:MAG TPA: ATP-binding protein [Desulfosporosinus sp.]|nr:ATP-binding protein [Desulfosporosinus sp.]
MQISRGKIARAQKVAVYGPEGIGKSTFASLFPNPIFIDTEGSTLHMDVSRTPKPSSFTMILEQVNYFKANPHLLDTLVIDTGDWTEQLCMTEICAKAQKKGIEDFGYGKGYTYLAEEFGRLLNSLEELVELGVNVVITAHAQMRKFEQPDEMGSYDRWEMKLQKKTAPLVKEWADMVLFANFKTYVVNVDSQGAAKGKNKAQGGKRVMYTTHHSCWDAKNRHDLKEELPFDFKEIAHCIPVRGSASPQPMKTEPDKKPVEQSTSTPEVKDTEPQTQTEAPTKVEVEQSQKVEVLVDNYQEALGAKEQLEQPTIDLTGVPKPLADLMTANSVTVQEIQQVVASRGYYPESTPIANYDPNFVSGVLVGAWTQVFGMIEKFRDDIPF